MRAQKGYQVFILFMIMILSRRVLISPVKFSFFNIKLSRFILYALGIFYIYRNLLAVFNVFLGLN